MYRIYSKKHPYSYKRPLPWFENKTLEHLHYMIIKKLLQEAPVPPVNSGGILITPQGIY